MPECEIKFCPRCGASFECKASAVWLCQCSSVPLNDAERLYISKRYSDCLCAKCLSDLKDDYHRQVVKAATEQA